MRLQVLIYWLSAALLMLWAAPEPLSAQERTTGAGVCGVPYLPKGYERAERTEMDLSGGKAPLLKPGQTRTFYVRKDIFSTDVTFESLEAELVTSSRLVDVWVEETEWNVRVSQSDVDALVNRFENSTPPGSFDRNKGILALEIERFGSPPDIDGNGRVIILLLDIRDEYDEETSPSFVAGYFDQADQMPCGTKFSSENCADILYIDTNPGNPGSDLVLTTAAHELQHLINYNYDQAEEHWLNEGLSEFASTLTGYEGRGYGGFLADANRGLMTWDNRLEDYSRVSLWMAYTWKRLGIDAVGELVRSPKHGRESFEETLLMRSPGTEFTRFFHDWTLANLLNDQDIADGRYSYRGLAIPALTLHDRNRLLPVPGVDADVKPFAARYSEFSGGSDLEISVDYSSASSLKGTVILYTDPLAIEPLLFDASGRTDFFAGGFGAEYDRLVLVTSFPQEAADSVQYFYSAEGIGGYEVTEIAYDDGEMTFPLHTGGRDLLMRFGGFADGSEVVSTSFMSAAGVPVDVELSVGGTSASPIYRVRNVVPSPLGWTEVDLSPAGIVTSGVGVNVIVRGDSIVMGYDHDTVGDRHAYLEREGRFAPLSDFQTLDETNLTGNWMIRLQLRTPADTSILRTFTLSNAYPNPFCPGCPENSPAGSTHRRVYVQYTLEQESEVKVYLYDLLGRLVSTWDEGRVASGRLHSVSWKGKADSGHEQPSGIYFFVMKADNHREVRKFVYLK